MSFLRKQESRPSCVCPRVLPAHAGIQNVPPYRRRPACLCLSPSWERPANRQVGRVRGPSRLPPAAPRVIPAQAGIQTSLRLPPCVIPAQAGIQPPLPFVGEAGLRSRPGEGALVSFLRKQESRLPCACPHVSFLRKQESRMFLRTAGVPPASASPLGGRGRPGQWQRRRPGWVRGALVSFLRKQESRPSCVCPRVLPAHAGIQWVSFPRKRESRPACVCPRVLPA